MKKFKLSLFLILPCLIFLMVFSISAADDLTENSRDVSFENELAADLRQLGLFSGVSETNFDLERAPTKIEAMVMLIRILGKEEFLSKIGSWHPFTDVPAWANRYIAYAYSWKLANGVSPTQFGTEAVNAGTYLTFVLRALGYSDTNGEDFTWDNPYDLAKSVGILPTFIDTENFWRADIVTISYAALNAKLKNENRSLAEKLIEAGIFTVSDYDAHYRANAIQSRENELSGYAPIELSAEEIYEKCAPAVFYIKNYDENKIFTSSGSGFFISETGIAVTNYHVIENATTSVAILSDTGEEHRIIGVYDYDIVNDWAVIQVEGETFPYLQTNMHKPKGGTSVYAIGNPKSLQNTMSQGIISSPSRTVNGTAYIQTTAAISEGSSGGALLNKYGEVIGITSAHMINGQNLNFACPVSYIENAFMYHMLSFEEFAKDTVVSFEISTDITKLLGLIGQPTSLTINYQSSKTPHSGVDISIVSSNKQIADFEIVERKDSHIKLKIYAMKSGSSTLTFSTSLSSDKLEVPVMSTYISTSYEYKASAELLKISVGESSSFTFTLPSSVPEDAVPDTKMCVDGIAEVFIEKDESGTYTATVNGTKAGATSLVLSVQSSHLTCCIPIVVEPDLNAAFDKLKTVLLAYGTDQSQIEEPTDANRIYLGISYDLESEKIAFSIMDTAEHVEVHIMLTRGDHYFELYFKHTTPEKKNAKTNGYAKLDAYVFNENTPISFSEYSSNYTENYLFKEEAAEFAMPYVYMALLGAQTYLSYSNLELSLADFGFLSLD